MAGFSFWGSQIGNQGKINASQEFILYDALILVIHSETNYCPYTSFLMISHIPLRSGISTMAPASVV